MQDESEWGRRFREEEDLTGQRSRKEGWQEWRATSTQMSALMISRLILFIIEEIAFLFKIMRLCAGRWGTKAPEGIMRTIQANLGTHTSAQIYLQSPSVLAKERYNITILWHGYPSIYNSFHLYACKTPSPVLH